MPNTCPKCNQENSFDSEFCKNCGAKLVPLEEIPIHTRTLQTPMRGVIMDVDVGEIIDKKYKLIEELGSGGMGVVYMAEQKEPVKRNVALKIIKLGMDTQEVVARFEMEKQALAVMTHPNIAKVYDAGATKSGRPYFVMELVSGSPITDYCDKHKLSIKERLELFIPVCEAVQHAHQKGVIHRDLKPSNVLVEVQGDKPTPKIIDFGIAKATEHRMAERTLFTDRGQLIGTPEYMSPEQAEISGLDIDTRTDIYSLGVMLYELLVGVLPFDPIALRSAGFAEIQRIIREEEPPRASTRFDNLGDTRTSVVEQRKTDIASLHKQLKGDLEWITMKAMEKDRTRRYATASELASDIDKHLRHEPVSASPPSAVYRIGKYIRRHKLGVAAAAFVLVAILIGTAGTTIGMIRAVRAEKKAVQEAATAQGVSDFLVNLFKVSDPSEARGNSITAREILDKGAKEINDAMKNQPAVHSRLMATLGEVFEALGLYKKAEPFLKNAVTMQRRALGNENRDTLKSIYELANLYWYWGREKDAEPLYLEVVEARRRILGEEHPDTLKVNCALASLYYIQGRYDAAEQLALKTLNIQRRVLGNEHLDTILSMHNLAGIYWAMMRFKEALPLNEEAVEIRRRTLGEDHPDTIVSLFNLATVHEMLGDNIKAEGEYVKALELSRRVLGDEHPRTVMMMITLTNLYKKQERFDRAEELLKLRLSFKEKAPGPDSQDLISAHRDLAEFYQDCLGNPTQAETHYRKIIDIGEQVYGKDNIKIVPGLKSLAGLYAIQRRFEKADPYLERSLAIAEKSKPSNNIDIARARLELATNYSAQGKSGMAESLYLRSLKIFGESQQVDKAGIFYAQARYWAACKNPGKAVQNLKQAVELGYKKSFYSDPYLKPFYDRPDFKAVYADILNHLNLDFEDYSPDGKPKFWSAGPKGYEVSIDQKEAYSGKVSLCIGKTASGRSLGVVSSSFPIEYARGKKLHFSGHIKTENVADGYAALWFRVDGPAGSVLALDNLQGRGPKGTTAWHEYVIELDIPKSGENIVFGVFLKGNGKAWFDKLQISLDGKSY
jgi:serine/threonine protein kinase/tetratricopeptide (TPR) repeat protein